MNLNNKYKINLIKIKSLRTVNIYYMNLNNKYYLK